MRMGALWLLLAATAFAADAPVVAHLDWEPEYEGFYKAFPRPFLAEAPAGAALPAGFADARFGTIETAVGTILVAVNATSLCLDTDLDGDLSDEAAVPFEKGAKVTITLPLDGADAPPVAVPFSLWRHEDDFAYLPCLHRHGRVELAGRVRQVALVDGNGDLRFDDPANDRLFVDLDGDGFLTGTADSHERIAPGEPFRVRDRGYAARVPEARGATVEFVPQHGAPPARPHPVQRWKPPPPYAPAPSTEPVADLVAALGAAAPDARPALLERIAACGNEAAARTLLAVAADAAQPADARRQAVLGLGRTAFAALAEDAVARLAAAPGEDAALRHAAVWSLHHMAAPGRGKVYAAMLGKVADKQLLCDTLACLYYADAAAARRLALALFRKEESAELRLQVYHSATNADQDGPDPALVKAALKDADLSIESDALRDMWALDEEKARDHAADMIGRRGLKSAWAAARVLGYHGDRPAVALLLKQDDVTGKTWNLLLDLLAPVRDPDAVKEIVQALKSPQAGIRSLAAALLAEIAAPGLTPPLVAALRKEKETDSLWRLVNALAAQGDPKAVAELVRVAGQDDFPARGTAMAALVRVGFGDAKVKAFFVKRLGAAAWDERIYALDAVADAGAADLAPRVVENLAHKQWQVRLAAAQCLRRVRVAEAVPALIALLGREENRRVRVAAADALFSLTGVELYDDARGWTDWWRDHAAGFAVPAQVPERRVAPGETSAAFFGVPVYSERVAFVLDRSSSMDAQDAGGGLMRLARAKAELLGAVAKLRTGAKTNVIFFGTEVDRFRDKLWPATDPNRAALEKHLATLEPEGRTNLWDALAAAFEDAETDTIYVLTDGVPNEGRWQRTYSILRELRQLNQTRRTVIHCVSVGRDSDLLRRIAAENGGTYVRR